ncbi:ROK family protein [Actinocorallia longicatena]|uniref:ROK family protein n=1 Tax=Actinocorallia longicatena TaxID=111803 RepID=UPI0031DAC018
MLRALYLQGPKSRQRLVGMTGLSVGTVSSLVTGLIGEGFVREAGVLGSDGGRPRTLVRIDPEYGYVVGAVVEETRLRVELFDAALGGVARASWPLALGVQGAEMVAARVLEGVEELLAEAGVARERVLGVGLGVPGVVEQVPEPVLHAQAYGLPRVPLGALLRAGTDLPVFLENGAKTLGQAEQWFGAGRDAEDLVVTLLGTGVGASIISHGTLYRGASSSAGEWGHTKVEPGGRMCRCGVRGCLEAYVGSGALLERYREVTGRDLSGGDEEEAVALLFADPAAAPVLDEAVRHLSVALSNLINLLNPGRVVLGGWLGQLLGRSRLTEIRTATGALTLTHPYAGTEIRVGEMGGDAVSVGAALLVVNHLIGPTTPAGAEP